MAAASENYVAWRFLAAVDITVPDYKSHDFHAKNFKRLAIDT
jgi:hypothetical protein